MTVSVHFFPPGSDEYVAGTSPDNSTAVQHPAFVARPIDTAEVAAVVIEAARRGLVVVPQATGHGAGGVTGDDAVILDTSGLTHLTIDAQARIASAGAGLTWGEINPQAEVHGLLGLAGSSPTVAISGYTFGGGFGWLTRPYGVASSALRCVEYVDGLGRIRVAADDAADPMDRDALWAFRGGGGVGVATRLDFDLMPVSDLHAGLLLWPIDDLDTVVAAWAQALPLVGDHVATSISVLHTPPAPVFPDGLRGVPVVHLAVASSAGQDGALPLLAAVRAAARPGLDTWGPKDAKGLAEIHLDPPMAVPALGYARWLNGDTPAVAADLLRVAAAPDAALAMLEIRSFDNHASTRPGAETAVVGPFALHAVGAVTDGSARGRIEDAFDVLRSAAAAVDLGRSLGSWAEGQDSVPDALAGEARKRVAAIADAVDPNGTIKRSRYVL